MKNRAEEAMNRLIRQLIASQTPEGSWDYPFETGISTDAYMIILLRTLEMDDEDLIRQLTTRILSKQETNGSWKLFYDEGDGNLSSTIEAYYALLYSGYVSEDDTRLLAAKKYIVANGGIEKAHMFTKIMLALTGQYIWPSYFPIPIEIVLLPLHFPVNYYDISVVGRANLAPIMILSDNKYVRKTQRSPNLTNLYTTKTDEFFNLDDTLDLIELLTTIEHVIKNSDGLPQTIHSIAINRTKQYMIEHIEPDGTLYSYFSSTFLMIFALLSLGHSNNDPLIIKAVRGLKSMQCTINGHTHMQYTTAAVWNTTLISFTLQRAGVPTTNPVIHKANQYLLAHQQSKYGDWAIHNPRVASGGWGFSNINTMNPDTDDTTAALRSISQQVLTGEPKFHRAWEKGVRWILSMQNDDGGWAAFEKNVDNELLNLLPIEGSKYLLKDSSSADLTGRTLEFLGNYTNMQKNNVVSKRGIDWILQNQEENGSWYGRWGICYIYGTWAAITGLIASGVHAKHPSIQKSINWLLEIQNRDGGWGESCKSDFTGSYVPLGASNITQTAWALDALITVADNETSEIKAGISFLLDIYHKDNWTTLYPVGQGMGGGLYIHYHSYQFIFPLLALTNYHRKFQQ